MRTIVELLVWLLMTSIVMAYGYEMFNRFTKRRKVNELLAEIEDSRRGS